MPPIPVYTDSPVAVKPSDATPETAAQAPAGSQNYVLPATTTAAQSTPRERYPQAQPGAVASMPAPTAAAQVHASSVLPTPTTHTLRKVGPPPPEPGAVPQPGGVRTHLPPPPKVGEKFVPPPAATYSQQYPPQMSYQPPTAAFPAQERGTSTAATPSSTYGGQVPGGIPGQSLQHPPGYQQNTNASILDRYQISAVQRDDAGDQQQNRSDAEQGVWNAAVKWAHATGEKLAAAETEVWKKINKE